jgi:Acyl-CoA carboxylase epsilon subunit
VSSVATASSQDAAPGFGGAPAVVVRGNATPEELAALVTVLAAAGGGEAPASDGATSTWAAHRGGLRRPVGPGPGAWRTALRP